MAAEIVHHPSPGKTEECESADTCGTKRKMKLRFSLTMLSEEDLENGGDQKLSHPMKTESIDEDIEDDCFDDDDQLLVSLTNMSFNLVDDQSPDTDEPSCSCDHQFNEVVITPEQADFGFISVQIGILTREQNNLFLKSKSVNKYIASGQSNQICLVDTMSAKISILRCKATNDTGLDVPVMLNFTGTNNYFSCTNEGDKKMLTITEYDKENLHNSGDDPKKTPLVFYMTIAPSGLRHFESALHRGWFIHTVESGDVKLKSGGLTPSNCFELIKTDATKTFTF